VAARRHVEAVGVIHVESAVQGLAAVDTMVSRRAIAGTGGNRWRRGRGLSHVVVQHGGWLCAEGVLGYITSPKIYITTIKLYITISVGEVILANTV
jgi:hypothetical protein